MFEGSFLAKTDMMPLNKANCSGVCACGHVCVWTDSPASQSSFASPHQVEMASIWKFLPLYSSNYLTFCLIGFLYGFGAASLGSCMVCCCLIGS